MTGHPTAGDQHRRPEGGGTNAAVVAPTASVALAGFLAAAALPQVASTARQAGRPTVDAVVVACPPSGGKRGTCTVRVAGDGLEEMIVLERATLLLPEPGDRLPVVRTPDATVEPAGWRPWLASGVLVALAAGAARGALFWGRRVLELRAPEQDERDGVAVARPVRPARPGRIG